MFCKSGDGNKSPVVLGIILLFSIAIAAMVFLSLVRCVFIASNLHEAGFNIVNTVKAIFIGIQFDGVVTAFILALPSIILIISTFFNVKSERLKHFLNIWIFTLFSLVFVLTIADIPYFAYFHDHLNINAFKWFEFFGDTMGMLFLDWRNYLYIIFIAITIILFVKTISYIEKRVFAIECEKKYGVKRFRPLPLALIYCAILFVGMRGTLELYPLRVGKAYFCDNAFYNRAGIAPVFNIIESMKNNETGTKKEIEEIDLGSALAFVQKEFGIDTAAADYDSTCPLNRAVSFGAPPKKPYNVIIILLESLSSFNLDLEYNGEKLMPFLNSLKSSSIYFPNFFSAGIHTNCGITATLYGYAPNFAQPTMTIPSDRYSGLPAALKQNGYSNIFFITGNPQYDRMNSFLYDNHIDKIYSQYDYPAEKIANNFGVQDDYLFEYGLKRLSEQAETGQPFFATFLTVSNHPPYVVPTGFQNRGSDDGERILSFVDNSVKEFIYNALEKDWGKNSVFVLLGDHGCQHKGLSHDMSLSFNHIPCFIITPEKRDTIIDAPCGQIDIPATVLGLLQLPYTNNTMGINILENNRDFTYFVNDNQIGCIDTTYFYCYNFNSQKEYLYKKDSGEDIFIGNKQQAEVMRRYCFNMMKVNFEAVRRKWNAEH